MCVCVYRLIKNCSTNGRNYVNNIIYKLSAKIAQVHNNILNDTYNEL